MKAKILLAEDDVSFVLAVAVQQLRQLGELRVYFRLYFRG